MLTLPTGKYGLLRCLTVPPDLFSNVFRFVISPSQMKLEIHYILREFDGLLASGDSSVSTKFIPDA